MRLPFPERVPLQAAVVAATILVSLQQLQQTSVLFSIYSFLFVVIAAIAFNTAGGFTRPSGSYVFFYSVLGLLVGLTYKAYLGEPADSNLRNPILTIQVFTGGITSMLFAVIVSRKISRRRPVLTNVLKEKDMKNAAVGCFAVGLFLFGLNAVIPHQNGSVLSALAQLDRFFQVSIIIGTLHAIKKSGGRTGFSFLVLLAIVVTSIAGALAFSKEGMFTPVLCWLVAACSMRLRIRHYQIVIGIAVAYVIFHFLVPYSQYGRSQVPENATFQDRLELSFSLLSDLSGVRQQYQEAIATAGDSDSGTSMDYFNEPQGFFDRLTMIGPDDALINYTSQGNFDGLSSIPADFANWIPHFLWPSKKLAGGGNFYAHEIGSFIGEDDYTTGISFTPTGEAYHLAGWVGIFAVAPIIWIMLFTLFDSICGDTRSSPWGLLVIALFAHVAPEGMLGGAIYVMWYGAVSILFVAMVTAQAMPVIGTLLAGPEKTGLVILRKWENRALRGIPPQTLKPSRSST
jgi:hypothetical protein